jgi:hypothetical protein
LIDMHLVRQIRIGMYIILLFASYAISRAGDSLGVSSTAIVRSQVQSIAEEIVDQSQLDLKGRVAVLVEGDGPRSLVENALVQVLQKRNCPSVLGAGVSLDQKLQLILLDVDIQVREIETKLLERKICTTLEARTVKGGENSVQLLGTYSRETKDTAQVFPFFQLSSFQKRDETGTLQRLLTPLIVIGGAILIIYLFYTVRS